MAASRLINKVLENKRGEAFTVKESLGGGYFLLEFADGSLVKSRRDVFTSGLVRNPNSPTLYGIGIIGVGKFSTKTHKKEYQLWGNMLTRCYNVVNHIKYPSYIGCEVSSNFKNFQYFAEWCQNQVGFGIEGYELDKDFVFKGNKVYSEDTCFFIPQQINTLLIGRGNDRGEYPIGVSFHMDSGKLVAQCSINGKRLHLGLYSTVEEAFRAYKDTKEKYIKELAIKYCGKVHDKVYDALLNYKVEITD